MTFDRQMDDSAKGGLTRVRKGGEAILHFCTAGTVIHWLLLLLLTLTLSNPDLHDFLYKCDTMDLPK